MGSSFFGALSCQRVLSAPNLVKWVFQQRVSLYTAYELVIDVGAAITAVKLTYDPSKVQWGAKLTPYATPAGGSLVRG